MWIGTNIIKKINCLNPICLYNRSMMKKETNKEFELKVKRSIKKFYKKRSMLKDKDVKEMGFEDFEWCCRNGFFGIGWIE